MKKQNTWRFVLKIVGVSLAAAGLICLLIGYWDKLMAFFGSIGEKCKGSCSEFDDYEDELIYE
mgnify:CR=1 FL=1